MDYSILRSILGFPYLGNLPYRGLILGAIQGDARSLDYGSDHLKVYLRYLIP